MFAPWCSALRHPVVCWSSGSPHPAPRQMWLRARSDSARDLANDLRTHHAGERRSCRTRRDHSRLLTAWFVSKCEPTAPSDWTSGVASSVGSATCATHPAPAGAETCPTSHHIHAIGSRTTHAARRGSFASEAASVAFSTTTGANCVLQSDRLSAAPRRRRTKIASPRPLAHVQGSSGFACRVAPSRSTPGKLDCDDRRGPPGPNVPEKLQRDQATWPTW